MKTILVVEDEKPLLEVVEKKLSLSGFEVVTAREVNQAVNYLKELPHVDCIWLDHYLFGDKNGLDLVAIIKNNPKWKNIPIFVVSNTASAEKVNTYLHLGIQKYYTKANYKLGDIITEINKTIEKGE